MTAHPSDTDSALEPHADDAPANAYAAALSSLPGASLRTLGPSDAKILSFMGLEGVSRGLMESGWDAAEEMKELVQIARYGEKEAARITAMRQIRKIVHDSAQLHGLIVTQQVDARARTPNSTTKLSARQTRLLTALQESQHDSIRPDFSPGSLHRAPSDSPAASLPPPRTPEVPAEASDAAGAAAAGADADAGPAPAPVSD